MVILVRLHFSFLSDVGNGTMLADLKVAFFSYLKFIFHRSLSTVPFARAVHARTG
jgi:hypothetical protein